MPTEKPILFTGPMVRAILAGEKTVTRRVVKPQLEFIDSPDLGPVWGWPKKGGGWWLWPNAEGHVLERCPYGQPGHRLWVRETWAEVPTACGSTEVVYAADYTDGSDREAGVKYRPSIHMPKWAARIWLEVVSVKVERVQDITEEGALAEGVQGDEHPTADQPGAVMCFAALWDSLNAKKGHGWGTNPWVWVIEFKRLDGRTWEEYPE